MLLIISGDNGDDGCCSHVRCPLLEWRLMLAISNRSHHHSLLALVMSEAWLLAVGSVSLLFSGCWQTALHLYCCCRCYHFSCGWLVITVATPFMSAPANVREGAGAVASTAVNDFCWLDNTLMLLFLLLYNLVFECRRNFVNLVRPPTNKEISLFSISTSHTSCWFDTI